MLVYDTYYPFLFYEIELRRIANYLQYSILDTI